MELRVTARKHLGSFLLDVDFTLNGNQIGIFGPSGAGKSVLVSLIAGLSRPDEGIITLDDEVLFDSSTGQRVGPERRRMGMVFQRPTLFPHLSVKGNLLYGYKRCAAENRRISFHSVVDVLQIGDLLTRSVRTLSGGQMQRVAIGRAVLGNPRLLLLDEPLSALDGRLKLQIIPFLKNVCETFEVPYLFITHSLLEMRLMAEHVLRILGGQVIEQTTAEHLVRSQMGQGEAGYANLLRLSSPRPIDGAFACDWGGQQLFISSANGEGEEALFELSSTDIILLGEHPEAISARNLLKCMVTDVFEAGARTGVELNCGGRLVAEITEQAAAELGICVGREVYAAIKASAFKRLG
jgi:molybdate transport system ATP-binding protein